MTLLREIKKSLCLLFFTHAVLIAVCWGWIQKPYIAVAAIVVWGTDDNMAALIGKKFGRHSFFLLLADPHKTWEESAAMTEACSHNGNDTATVPVAIAIVLCIMMAFL